MRLGEVSGSTSKAIRALIPVYSGMGFDFGEGSEGRAVAQVDDEGP